MSEVVLLARSVADFGTLAKLATTATGHSPLGVTDGCGRQLDDAERWLSCLAVMADDEANVGLAEWLLDHAWFSLAAAAATDEVPAILAVSAGLAAVPVETVRRDITLLILSGTLRQWRDAVRQGLQNQRTCDVYLSVSRLFQRLNLGGLFEDRPASLPISLLT